MKENTKTKLALTTLVVLVSVLLISKPVSAASQLAIQGIAEVVSTGGSLDFDQYNSNVTVDTATGDVSGYVWSTDLGWIDSDNNGNSNSVKIDLDDGKVSGLAYVVNTGGVIDFTNYNSNTVVDLSSGAISGYAWSEDLGWIDFSNVRISHPLAMTGQNILPILILAILIAGIPLLVLRKGLKKTS